MYFTNILLGIALLTAGRRLFWLFVGGVGFLAGLDIAAQLLAGRPQWVILAAAAAAGIIGVILALLLQQAAILTAGFFAGGYAGVTLFSMFAPAHTARPAMWLFGLLGGIIGMLLMKTLFSWALIFLSSFVGALLIFHPASPDSPFTAVVFTALCAFGMIIQIEQQRKTGSRRA